MDERLKNILQEKAEKGEFFRTDGSIDLKKFLDMRDFHEQALQG